MLLGVELFNCHRSGFIFTPRSEMNRFQLAAIFFCGIFFSVFIELLKEYLKWKYVRNEGEFRKFAALPQESQLRIVDEDRTSVYIKGPEEKKKKPEGSDKEAISSLSAALEMKNEGKHDKAMKLFQHAAILAPKHPDILNYYGEFLEETQNDIMLADQLYFQALMYSPDHTKALSNRQRTASLVEEMDRNMLKRIDLKRDQISAVPDSNRGLRRAKKEAYFQHIYHTVGIEGNTMSLSQTRSIVETQVAVGGKSIMEHNEILGLDAAMKYINATLVNRFGPITLKDILEIHRRVLGYVDPFGSGAFRRTQVYVGDHVPPAPNDIPPLMKGFEQWLNSESAVRMHPIQYAALAHYKLVHIHPFDDGNGRTSRLLMNTILMQAGFPPVIIFKQDRHRYYEYLERANEGDIRPFVRFIAECTEKTLDLFLWATNEYSSRIPAIDDDSKTIILESNVTETDSHQTNVVKSDSSV
ncbi:UNVERIFIED_CONTAM: hypothetical protein PYX00_000623 [Menopon gallinae]|uniref:Protein adenylyltransferase Fic n=1 Tax=Menopon gallinae TaxID=328185 RepID=A0AAW2I9Y4_9NEOP